MGFFVVFVGEGELSPYCSAILSPPSGRDLEESVQDEELSSSEIN